MSSRSASAARLPMAAKRLARTAGAATRSRWGFKGAVAGMGEGPKALTERAEVKTHSALVATQSGAPAVGCFAGEKKWMQASARRGAASSRRGAGSDEAGTAGIHWWEAGIGWVAGRSTS